MTQITNNTQVDQTNQIDQLNQTGRRNSDIDVNSIELMFATLQNDLAKENRDAAKGKIEDIKKAQQEQKQISNAVVELRNAITGMKEDSNITADKIEHLNDVIKMCEGYGIKLGFDEKQLKAVENLTTAIKNADNGQIEVSKIPGINDIRSTLKNSEINYNTKHYPNYTNISTRDLFGVKSVGWKHVSVNDAQELIDNIRAKMNISVASINSAITSLQNKQETIGSDKQQEMLLIQDLMSKVSSYSQGAIGAINKSGDTLTAIVR